MYECPSPQAMMGNAEVVIIMGGGSGEGGEEEVRTPTSPARHSFILHHARARGGRKWK